MAQRIQYQFYSRRLTDMNYVAVMPNAMYNLGFQNQMSISRPSQSPLNPSQANNLLQVLSKALRSSLNNFEERVNQASRKTLQAQVQAKNGSLSGDNCLDMMGEPVGEEAHKENLKNNMEVEPAQVFNENLVNLDKSSQGGLVHTDDEIQIESSSLRKDGSSKKKNKKIRKEEKQDSFMVAVPEVDLIDDASLLPLDFPARSLAQKKEELMMRRVLDCNDFLKGRKEKREIRMLGN